jgi:hypothetical protein
MYVSPSAVLRCIGLEGWIACTVNNLSIGGITGAVGWDGSEVILGDEGGMNEGGSDGGSEGGNVHVSW